MKRQPVGGHPPAFEAKVALTVLKNDRTIAQLAEQFDAHANRISSRKQLVESLP
jgi:transposase